MQHENDRGASEAEGQGGGAAESRPQKAGEAATTRFGMEEGDNSDIPATGDGMREEDGAEGSGRRA